MSHVVIGVLALAGIAAMVGFIFYKAARPGPRYQRMDIPRNDGDGLPPTI